MEESEHFVTHRVEEILAHFSAGLHDARVVDFRVELDLDRVRNVKRCLGAHVCLPSHMHVGERAHLRSLERVLRRERNVQLENTTSVRRCILSQKAASR